MLSPYNGRWIENASSAPSIAGARRPSLERLFPNPRHIACALALAMTCSSAVADDKDFYFGKRLTYIVATKPGGGYDLYARLVARHLPRHLGVRSVVIRNVPGASHLIGLQQLFAAEPDGLTIGTFNTGLVIGQRYAGADFDLSLLSWVGKAAAEPRIFVVAVNSELRNFEDLRNSAHPVLVATSGKLSSANLEMELIASVFRFRIRAVHGFSGADADLAIVREDVEGALMSLSSTRSLLQNGQARPVFFIGRPETLPAVEALSTIARTGEEKQLAEKLQTLSELGRLSAGPPGIPPERLRTLREAYLDTLRDPALLKDAESMRLPIDPWEGARVAAAVEQFKLDP